MAEFGHPVGAVAARLDCARPAPPEDVRHTDAFGGGVGHGRCLGRYGRARAGDSQMAATPWVVWTSELNDGWAIPGAGAPRENGVASKKDVLHSSYCMAVNTQHGLPAGFTCTLR